MATAAISRLAGTCECCSDGCRTHSAPPQCQSRLTVWRRNLGNHRHEETGPGNHKQTSRQTTNSKQRFLTPFLCAKPPMQCGNRCHEPFRMKLRSIIFRNFCFPQPEGRHPSSASRLANSQPEGKSKETAHERAIITWPRLSRRHGARLRCESAEHTGDGPPALRDTGQKFLMTVMLRKQIVRIQPTRGQNRVV